MPSPLRGLAAMMQNLPFVRLKQKLGLLSFGRISWDNVNSMGTQTSKNPGIYDQRAGVANLDRVKRIAI